MSTISDPLVDDPDLEETFGPDQVATGMDAADRLQEIIERADSWPVWSADNVGGVDTNTYAQIGKYGQSMADLALWVAFREADRQRIITLTNWEKDRPMHFDPLPERISAAFADLLYGNEPTFVAANSADQDKMDEMIEETGLAVDLHRWVDMQVSEGEAWWRIWTDQDASEWPLIDIHSRINVVPLFAGHKPIAAAFVDNIYTQQLQVENQFTWVHYRHVEIQATGYVRNLLYQGTLSGLGKRIPLNTLPETANLETDWEHGLPMVLAGRITNKMGRDPRLGISEFQKVRDLLLDLIEARTIMAENARLVLKARMVVPANAIDAEGKFQASQDVIVAESLDEEMAGKGSNAYAVLEYNFRSNELIQHKTELTLDILARCGLAEQFVQESRGGGGQAFTGTALRTRLIPTIQSASGKAKSVDREVPKAVRAMAMVSALPTERGGCGQSWSQADGKHLQKRATIIPDDQNEEVQRHVMAVQGEVESVETAVHGLHPDWDDPEVEAEVERIREDHTPPVPALGDPNGPSNPNIPNVPPGGPGSKVPTPASVVGSQQPGANRGLDGQSPGKKPPQVTAGAGR